MISLLGRGAHRRNGHSLVWVSTLFFIIIYLSYRILIMPSIILGIKFWSNYLSNREHRHDLMYMHM